MNWRKVKKQWRARYAPCTAKGGRNGSNKAMEWAYLRGYVPAANGHDPMLIWKSKILMPEKIAVIID